MPPTSTPAPSSTPPTSKQPTCTTCHKPPTPTTPLKRCARCHSARYCSPACQKADWKRSHKGYTCTFGAITNNRYLESLPGGENEVFDVLVDIYRMRVEDEYVMCGDAGGLYGGMDPTGDFREFLGRAEGVLVRDLEREVLRGEVGRLRGVEREGEGEGGKGGVVKDENGKETETETETKTSTEDNKNPSANAISLPPNVSPDAFSNPEKLGILPLWWNAEKRRACIRRARDRNSPCCIYHAVETSDIVEHYADSLMPMKLRLMGERVYGGPVGYGGMGMGGMMEQLAGM
ncbi:hypothetical protein FQN55_004409 [Onygenales sp. PD_40]|nr:hypothetical protein FQN55_004409 [Onygenales sp. PD_40]